MSATIVSVNISPGGIPKRPIEVGRVTAGGIDGDRHDHDIHDTPLQAISLIDAEDLDDLRGEGYDVGPGAMGENLTVAGLQVDGLRPGDRLVLSGGVVLEYTKARKPCFVLDSISPQLKTIVPGRCGGYAKVIEAGEVRPGETIRTVRGAGRETERWPHTGAVLAGGASRRMGRPKHELLVPGGRTMLETVSTALEALCRQVIVVGAAETDRRRIDDLRPAQGPLGGIESLLASGLDEQYLVCPCDVPLLTPALLSSLTGAPNAAVAVFQIEGEDRIRCLPARFPAEALAEVRRSLDSGRRAVHECITALGPVIIPLSKEQARLLANVNTPQEYGEITSARS